MAPAPSPDSPFSQLPAEQPDALVTAARLAASATGAPIGLVCLGAGEVAVWGAAPGISTAALPAPDGFASRHLVRALAADPYGARAVTALADHPVFAGVVGAEVEGLTSVATAPIRDASGVTIGFVGAFDRVPRVWGAELDQLDGIARLLTQSAPQLRQAAATRLVATTVEALERSLGAESIQAVLDVVAHGDDAALRRQASEAQSSIDHASVLRGRLRAALRSTPFAGPRIGIFDLVTTAERAVAEVCRRRHTTPLPVSSPEPRIPVSGDAQRAHVAISRCVAAALTAGHQSDLSVQVSTRAIQSERLDGRIVGELSISVKGAALGVPELTHVVSGLFGAQPGAEAAASAVTLRLGDGETRLVAPGFDATATAHGTWVTLRWPIDLG
jgi:hypothetical protein